ncbi:MAG: class B sortase [Oscillospiraceae bacterium]|nr:class B sortase [Oscillospiraceae bacterium]
MKKKGIYILLGVLCLAAAVVCVWQLGRRNYAPQAETESISATLAPTATAAPAATEEPLEEAEAAAPETAEEPYESPIDFEELQAVNSDIYAWLQIDNTNIDYPIVQHPTDNTYYMTHNSDGDYSANGAVFSELYNSTDFTDPVTVLYGHHMNSGAIFGNLQSYYLDSEFFAENPNIKVYTPDGLLEYAVFAAVPYSNSHLLYNNDFTDDSVFTAFFEDVLNIRSIGALLNEDNAPEAGDKVLVLSTCLAGDNTRRFLVMATLVA